MRLPRREHCAKCKSRQKVDVSAYKLKATTFQAVTCKKCGYVISHKIIHSPVTLR